MSSGSQASLSSLSRLIDEVSQAACLVRSYSHARHLDDELTPSSHRVLAVISRKQPIHAAEIASQLGIGTAAVSRHLSDLLARNLVSKNRNTDDSRRTILNLTQTGREMLELRRVHQLERFAALLPEWTESKITDLSESLAELNAALKLEKKENRLD